MEVNISNKPARIDRKEIIAAANFYANTLMNAQLVRNLKIDIEFENLHNIDAQCNWEDRNVRPRWFTIQIDNRMGRRKVLLNLAHEMVHVKQHATDESRNDLKNGNLHLWQGKVIDEDTLNYYDLPWEVDAFGREHGLYVRFMASQRVARRLETGARRAKRG
jgi:hypothetical protein